MTWDSVISLIVAVIAGVFSIHAAFRAEKANAEQAHLKARLDLGLAKMMEISKQEIDVLLEVSASIADAPRRAMTFPIQLWLPALDDMSEGRLEEFLTTTSLSPSQKRELRDVQGERTQLYARYLSRQALNQAWQAVRSLRTLLDSKAPLLAEPVVSALYAHMDLLVSALSGYEEDRVGRIEGTYLAEWRQNINDLEPRYHQVTDVLRAALHDQPETLKL